MSDLNAIDAARESISGSIILANPEWLWVLPVLVFATFLWGIIGGHQQAASLSLGSLNVRHKIVHPLISLVPGIHSAPKIPSLHIMIYGIALTSLVISLANPTYIGKKLPDPPQERDIIFIVDTSISMTLRDYVLDGERVDRMTLLKSILGRFVRQFPGERIGIIVFGDAAYTLVPLTRDQHLIQRMLSRIQATMVGRFNNMGEAIALAVKQSQQQREARRHQVLVMLTDADRPTGLIDPFSAASLALENKIPLYTVAIGATTTEAEEKRITGLIYEPVDSVLLTTIAEHTGGKNYQAGNAQSFEKAVNDISLTETNKRSLPPLYEKHSFYYWPLLFGAFLLLALPAAVTIKQLFVKSK